jgi:2-oxoglutarate ferredoxin oxidoreductase subunit beta
MTETFSTKQYLRPIAPPFCAGCGSYTIMNTFLRAVHGFGQENLRKFVFCSGIGCAAWIPSPHFLADTIHTPHGRSITVATGIKLLRPDLNVVVFGGDGDIVGIGLSHFIHAARRNLDILVIMVNNMIYGMTGGQVAPTTPSNIKTTTTPYGNFEQPLDAAQLALAAGATYSARWTTLQATQLKESIEKALNTRGFRFIEVISQCPTAFGRRAGFKDTQQLLKWFKENTQPIKPTVRPQKQESSPTKILIGEFVEKQRPNLLDAIIRGKQEAKKTEN